MRSFATARCISFATPFNRTTMPPTGASGSACASATTACRWSRTTFDMELHNCRVVLVRPQIAGNLGAAARAMRNLGLTDLVLVAPQADPADRNARQLSTHG